MPRLQKEAGVNWKGVAKSEKVVKRKSFLWFLLKQ